MGKSFRLESLYPSLPGASKNGQVLLIRPQTEYREKPQVANKFGHLRFFSGHYFLSMYKLFLKNRWQQEKSMDIRSAGCAV